MLKLQRNSYARNQWIIANYSIASSQKEGEQKRADEPQLAPGKSLPRPKTKALSKSVRTPIWVIKKPFQEACQDSLNEKGRICPKAKKIGKNKAAKTNKALQQV